MARVRRESNLDRSCARLARKAGFLWIKLSANTTGVGMPDRLLAGPDGTFAFCELKSLTGTLTSAQKNMHATLRELGHTVIVIRSSINFVDTLNKML